VYPYSIIPGGVSGVAELKRIIRSDRVVAAHYASFNVDAATEVTVSKPRAVYVSYRKGDQVFWTAKKLMLAQGETLLTDGANEMRARCANRISDLPRFPVEVHGPSEAELDAALAEGPEDAGFMLASAPGIGPDDGAGSGQRFQTLSFPNGAGLLPGEPAPAASARSAPPYVRQADRATLYSYGPTDGTSRSGAFPAVPGEPAPTPANSPGAPGWPTGGEDSVPGNDDDGTVPGLPQDGFPAPDPFSPLPQVPGTLELPVTPTEVPEPGTLWLSAAAASALLWMRRKKK